MSKVILKKPAQLTGVVRKVSDKTMNIRFNTCEATSKELSVWDEFAGMTGYLAFSLDSIQEEDIPKEDTEFQTKTHSQRLRSALYVWWSQLGEKGNFQRDFYEPYMEKKINEVKNNLN